MPRSENDTPRDLLAAINGNGSIRDSLPMVDASPSRHSHLGWAASSGHLSPPSSRFQSQYLCAIFLFLFPHGSALVKRDVLVIIPSCSLSPVSVKLACIKKNRCINESGSGRWNSRDFAIQSTKLWVIQSRVQYKHGRRRNLVRVVCGAIALRYVTLGLKPREKEKVLEP